MRIINVTLIFAILSPDLKGALATTSSITDLSAISEAAETIKIPYDGIADPNKILGQSAKQKLADKLQLSSHLTVNREGRIEATSTRIENSNNAKDNKNGNGDIENATFPVQIAVAIVEGMEFLKDDVLCENDDYIEEVTGQFATSLHNKWGIGEEIIPVDGEGIAENKCVGGTGLLVFLSIRDRVAFISVGGALKHLLTNGRIDRIIRNDMREDLKRANYELGLTKGIDAIIELLERGEEPSVCERISEKVFNTKAIVALLYIFLIGNGALQRRQREKEKRMYAKVAARLSELDRVRANALRGSYQRTASCPICLEEFLSTEFGSDGHRIQLLRCGHVFDKTCYQEWISSGCGDVTKCPVCRADVGIGFNEYPPRSRTNLSVQFRRSPNDSGSRIVSDPQSTDFAFEDDNGNDNYSRIENGSDHDNHMMTHHRTDRNFRLERLSELYPRYITSETVARWCSSTFNGSLVHDVSFRNRNPVVPERECLRSSSARDSEDGFSKTSDHQGDYSFGGGTSAGGRVGRF